MLATVSECTLIGRSGRRPCVAMDGRRAPVGLAAGPLPAIGKNQLCLLPLVPHPAGALAVCKPLIASRTSGSRHSDISSANDTPGSQTGSQTTTGTGPRQADRKG